MAFAICDGQESLATVAEYLNLKTIFGRVAYDSKLKAIVCNHETNYLSTVLGLVLLSGFFKKPILLITSSESLKCLLDSQADRGAFKIIWQIAEMRFYRIQVSSSTFLRKKQGQPREDFVAKVYARSFSELLDALQAERWGIERDLGAEGSTNHGRSYKLRDVARIPYIHNIPVLGSILQTLLVTDDQVKTSRRPDVYATTNVDGNGSDMTAYNCDLEIGDEDNIEDISEHQEEGTSDASDAELSTEDESDNDSENCNYESDSSNHESSVSDTEVTTAELAAEEVTLEYVNDNYYNRVGNSYKANDLAWEPQHRLSLEESSKDTRQVYPNTTKGLLYDIDAFKAITKIGSLSRGVRVPVKIFSKLRAFPSKEKKFKMFVNSGPASSSTGKLVPIKAIPNVQIGTVDVPFIGETPLCMVFPDLYDSARAAGIDRRTSVLCTRVLTRTLLL